MEEIVGGQEEFIVSHVKRKKAEESKIETQITGSISGPKLKISKKEIDIFEINDLPTGELYERSYMHKDIIHKIIISHELEVIITISVDGHIKFWKKVFEGIEFLRHYKAHPGKVAGVCLSYNGRHFASTCNLDSALKIYDVQVADMIYITKINTFLPGIPQFIHSGSDITPMLAIAEYEGNKIHIIKGDGSNEEMKVIEIHNHMIIDILFNPISGIIISTDVKGFIEYSDHITYEFPLKSDLKFNLKSETQLFELCKQKSHAISMSISMNGRLLGIYTNTRMIYIYHFRTGRIYRSFNESLQKYGESRSREEKGKGRLELDRKLALEREMGEGFENGNPPNVVFNEQATYIIYSSYLGIKLVHLKSKQVVRILGRSEPQERFLHIELLQGTPKRDLKAGGSSCNKVLRETDPTVFSSAYKRNRFFLFTRREPDNAEIPQIMQKQKFNRDVLNERPTQETIQNIKTQEAAITLPSNAIIYTSVGEIDIKLFPKECPKTVENFVVHSRNKYYDGVIFHRVVKGFMVQTGDPDGDGTGGHSIWGSYFEDEFVESLKHDRPFTLSMANMGVNTNGSQFFITTVACGWLDNKHTVFGRCLKGMDVVQEIENIHCDDNERPFRDIKIITIKIIDSQQPTTQSLYLGILLRG